MRWYLSTKQVDGQPFFRFSVLDKHEAGAIHTHRGVKAIYPVFILIPQPR